MQYFFCRMWRSLSWNWKKQHTVKRLKDIKIYSFIALLRTYSHIERWKERRKKVMCYGRHLCWKHSRNKLIIDLRPVWKKKLLLLCSFHGHKKKFNTQKRFKRLIEVHNFLNIKHEKSKHHKLGALAVDFSGKDFILRLDKRTCRLSGLKHKSFRKFNN